MSRPNEQSETCGCGARYQLKHKDRHFDKSAKHARWLQNRVANSDLVQNNTNNHVGQQTYNNISNSSNNSSHDNASYGINNYVQYPTYYNNASYDNNEYYDAEYYNPADMYDPPEDVFDISEMLSEQARAKYLGMLQERDVKYNKKFYNNPQPKLNRYELASSSKVKKTNNVRDDYNVNSITSGHNVLEYFQDIYPTCENILGNYMSRFRVIKFVISLMVEYIHAVEGRPVYVGHRSCNIVMKSMNQLHDLYSYIYNLCKYKYNITGLEFPITIPDGIRKFEKLNPNIAINVFEYIPVKDAVKRGLRKDFDIANVYSTNNYRTTARVVDLLLIEDQHYALITNFNAFASSQYRLNIKHSGGDTGNVDEIKRENNYPDDKKRKELIKFGVYGKEKQVNVCRKCLMPKCTLNAYIEHIKLCIGNEPCIPKMPKDNFPKEYLDAIRIALQNENNKRSLCTGVHPRT